MYFDAVVTADYELICNDKPEEILACVQTRRFPKSTLVIEGRTMKILSVPEYIKINT